MDDEVKELLEQGIVERAQIAFVQMRQENPRLDELWKGTTDLSDEVEHCAGMDEETKTLVQRFLSQSANVDSEFQKYLYIQGARDCVEILREFGVIQ